MSDIVAILIAVVLGASLWLNLLQLVLRHEQNQLAPARSGGGTSSAAGRAPSGLSPLPTPR